MPKTLSSTHFTDNSIHVKMKWSVIYNNLGMFDVNSRVHTSVGLVCMWMNGIDYKRQKWYKNTYMRVLNL